MELIGIIYIAASYLLFGIWMLRSVKPSGDRYAMNGERILIAILSPLWPLFFLIVLPDQAELEGTWKFWKWECFKSTNK